MVDHALSVIRVRDQSITTSSTKGGVATQDHALPIGRGGVKVGPTLSYQRGRGLVRYHPIPKGGVASLTPPPPA